MRELNIEFQEQYKRLDKLCKDLYSSEQGVSSYIQDMEFTPYNERKVIYNWEVIYKQLKHVRWVRNQLAHEVDIDTDICEQSDIDWIKMFYESIITRKDPMACVYAAKRQTVEKSANAHSNESFARANKATGPVCPERSQLAHYAEKTPDRSLWNRIVSKIKDWFS